MIKNTLKNLDFLIRQDTQNPPRKISQNDLLYTHLTNHFKVLGFNVVITDLGEGHVIFYAVKGMPEILFNVHLDTVPVTESTLSSWSHPPFKLTVEDGKVYGRGSCDIKGAAACLMELAQYNDNMAVLFTSDEEGASGCCVQHFIDNTDLSQYKQVIVAEPTLSTAVLSHRGYLSAYVEFAGDCGHSSMAKALETNAIHKSNRWMYKALDYAKSFINENNPAGICFNVGVIKGGEKNNMIAEKVNLDFSARVPAGMTSEKVFSDLKSYDDDSKWHAGMMAPPLPAAGQSDEKAIKFCRINDLEMSNPVDFWTEAALFSNAGLPAIVLGPGNIKQAHTIDEWVEVTQLENILNIYSKLLSEAKF